MAIGLITYDDAARREDLTDILTNISPKETPLLSGLQFGPDAQQTLHEFLTDTFAASADNAQAEGAGFTVTDLTQPSRATNVTQIFLENIQVSRTETKVNIGGMSNAFEYQIQKNMVEHAKDIEHALMRGSRASGDSGVARRMDGVMASITTMATARASGDSLSETIFNDIMEMVKGQTDETVDEVYVAATLRRDISAFSGNTNSRFMIDAEDRRLINTIDVYVSDWGPHKVFYHRDLSNTANELDFVGINSKYWGISWLDRTHSERLPLESVDRMRAQIVSELTLEDRAENSSVYYTGFTG